MALKDTWKDLEDGVSKVVVKPINDIAEAVINLENNSLPSATEADNGKILRIVDGEWEAVELPSVREVSF